MWCLPWSQLKFKIITENRPLGKSKSLKNAIYLYILIRFRHTGTSFQRLWLTHQINMENIHGAWWFITQYAIAGKWVGHSNMINFTALFCLDIQSGLQFIFILQFKLMLEKDVFSKLTLELNCSFKGSIKAKSGNS